MVSRIIECRFWKVWRVLGAWSKEGSSIHSSSKSLLVRDLDNLQMTKLTKHPAIVTEVSLHVTHGTVTSEGYYIKAI